LHEAPARDELPVDVSGFSSTEHTPHEVVGADEAFGSIHDVAAYQTLTANGPYTHQVNSFPNLTAYHTFVVDGATTHQTFNPVTGIPLEQTFTGLELTIQEPFDTFPSATGYTPSVANGTTTLADMYSFTEFSASPHFHATPSDIQVITAFDLQQHWLSADVAVPSACPHHDPILQQHVTYDARGLGPMERYLTEGPWEQSTIVTRSDTGELSTTRDCRCLAMTEVEIDQGEGFENEVGEVCTQCFLGRQNLH
jgi:hypothetical protein